MTVNWGTGLAATYVVFAAATGGVVAWAMNRPVALVSPDYYAESLRLDDRLTAERNAQALGASAAIDSDHRDRIDVTIPVDQSREARGSITLYRPSDPAADCTLAFVPNSNGRQILDAARLARGLWLVQLRWSAHGRDYYLEQAVTLK